MSLSDIVNVTISRQTSSVSRTGFGTPLILGVFSTTHFSDRARVYDSIAALEADGFGSAHFVHKAMTAFMAQSPKVDEVVVGRRALPIDRNVRLTPVAAPPASTAYNVLVNDQTATFTTDATPTVAEITAGLAAAINALMPAAWAAVTPYVVGNRRKNGGNIYIAVVAGTSAASGGPSGTRDDIVDGTVTWAYVGPTVTATDVGPGTSVLINQDTAGAPYVLEVENRALLTQKDETTDPGIATDLSSVRTDPTGNDDWYAAVADSHAEAEINALAAAIEALPKMFIASCADDDILTTSITDVASDLQSAAYARTALLFHPKPHSFPEAAWAGTILPLDPGSATWKFKTLAGITVYTLTPNERNNIVGKSANVYERIAGNNITAEGTTGSGEFIDITHFIDFISARLQENIFSRLINANKIPFTDAGIAIIENEVRGVMNLGISVGGFAADPAPVVTVPRAADVSSVDKANRLLPDVNFTATLAGAIHEVEVNGVVTV